MLREVHACCMHAFDPAAACAQLTIKLLVSNRTTFTSLLCSPCAIPQQVTRDMRIRRRALWDGIRLSFRGLQVEQLLQILNDAFWNGSAVKLHHEVYRKSHGVILLPVHSLMNNGGTNIIIIVVYICLPSLVVRYTLQLVTSSLPRSLEFRIKVLKIQ